MRAIAIRAHGGLDQLELRTDWPDPAAGPGQAVVEVKACGLNYLDIFVLHGMPGLPVEMPRIPGGDIAGVVHSVGAGVSRDWLGKRVLVDPHIKHGGALGMMITRGHLQPGELVLILGASGGVGTGCVQIAKNLKARVIACASSASKLRRLQELGADHVIDYTKEDFSKRAWEISGKKGVDVLVNYTGGDTWVPSLRTLARHGRLLTCGATAGFDPKTDIRYIWRREVNIIGANGWTRQDLEALLVEVERGSIKPVIHGVYPLVESREAMRVMEDREVFGKIIVVP